MVMVRENNEGEYSEVGGRFGRGRPGETALQKAVSPARHQPYRGLRAAARVGTRSARDVDQVQLQRAQHAVRSADVGGTASTEQVTAAVVDLLARHCPDTMREGPLSDPQLGILCFESDGTVRAQGEDPQGVEPALIPRRAQPPQVLELAGTQPACSSSPSAASSRLNVTTASSKPFLRTSTAAVVFSARIISLISRCSCTRSSRHLNPAASMLRHNRVSEMTVVNMRSSRWLSAAATSAVWNSRSRLASSHQSSAFFAASMPRTILSRALYAEAARDVPVIRRTAALSSASRAR